MEDLLGTAEREGGLVAGGAEASVAVDSPLRAELTR